VTNWLMHNRSANRIPFTKETISLPLRQLWKSKLSSPILTQQVANSEMVLTSCLDGLYSNNISTGDIEWRFLPVEGSNQQNSFKATPAICRNLVVVTDTLGNLYCIELENGKLVWMRSEYSTRNDSICIANESIYSRYAFTESGDIQHGIASISLDGSLLWSYFGKSPIRTRSCSIDENRLVFGDMDGILHCLDSRSGELIWKKDIVEFVQPVDIPKKFLNQEISFVGFPLISRSVVVVSSNDRRNILGLDLQTGELKWHHLVDQDLEGVSSAFHMTSDGEEFWYLVKDNLRSVDMASGHVQTKFIIADNYLGRSRSIESVIVGVHLFAAFDESRCIAALNLQTGSLDWIEQCESGFAAGCIWAHEKLFAGDDQGTIYCYQ